MNGRVEITVEDEKHLDEKEAALLLLAEIRDLLVEVRDALTPDPGRADECPECGSPHSVRQIHKPDHACGAGACLRAGAEGSRHFLIACRDCNHTWVEQEGGPS